MRYDYIAPFIATTLRILQTVLPGAVRQGDPVMVRADEVAGEVRVVIAILGDSPGAVILAMDGVTALAACSSLLGARIEALTAAGLDALAELGNMIAGNALSSLNDLGFDLRVSPPTVVLGSSPRPGDGEREAMQIPIACPSGLMTVNLLIRNE